MKTIPLEKVLPELKWWTDRYLLIADGNARIIELENIWITYLAEIHGSDEIGGSDEYGNYENVFVESGRYVEIEAIEYDENGNETPVHIEGLEEYIENNLTN